MESSNSKKNVPQLGIGASRRMGLVLKMQRRLQKEFVFEARKDKSGDRFLHIAFV